VGGKKEFYFCIDGMTSVTRGAKGWVSPVWRTRCTKACSRTIFKSKSFRIRWVSLVVGWLVS